MGNQNKNIDELLENIDVSNLVIETTKDGIWDWDLITNKVNYSNSWKEMLGYSEDEITDSLEEWSNRIHPNDKDRVMVEVRDHLDGKTQFYEIEYRINAKSGNYLWILDRGKITHTNESGKPLRMVGTHTDITKHKELELKLIESEKKLETFFSQSLDGFFFMMLDEPIVWNDSIDKDKALEHIFKTHRVTKVNEAMLNQYKAKIEEFIGLTPNDFFAHNINYGKDLWIKLFDNGRLHIETDERRFDGSQMFIVGDYICLYDDDGRISGHFGVQRDVTEKKIAESFLTENTRKLQDAQRIAHLGNWELDTTTFKSILSEETYRIFGLDNHKTPTYNQIQELVHHDDLVKFKLAIDNTIESSIPFNIEIRIISPSGSVRYVNIIGQPQGFAGRVTKIFSTVMDITERKYSEISMNKLIKELQESKDQIEKQLDELNELNKELSLSENTLKELNATKDKFFSIIAHDLKNPLGNFRDVTNILFENYNSFTDSEKMDYLNMMREISDQVYTLTDNLLEWSRSQRGKITFVPMKHDLYLIVNTLLPLLALAAQKKNIQINSSIKESTFAYCDANIVTTILRNLITNALKFTNEKGEINIFSKIVSELQLEKSIKSYNSDQYIFEDYSQNKIHTDYLELNIQDNGIGITKENLKKLFRIDENFTSEGTSKEKGTGLGLILCKEFIQMHKGKIVVESEKGKGSIFKIYLPINNIFYQKSK